MRRAGWTFWRCFASTWRLHEDDVLRELLDRLTSMGIVPLGAIEHMPLLVETRIIKAPNTRLDAVFGTAAVDELVEPLQ